MDTNELSISLDEFKTALAIFTKGKIIEKNALIAFDGKHCSIEIGDKTAVMVASGVWNGKAYVSSQLIRAFASTSPAENPIKIIYKNENLQFAGVSLKCTWEKTIDKVLNRTLNPSLLELLALEKTLQRHELGKTPLGKKCRSALTKLDKSIEVAMKNLSEFGVKEEQIREIVEINVKEIINKSKHF